MGRQGWRDLLFLHWPVAAAVLRPLVPGGLELDTFDGQAYVTLIPFAVVGARAAGAVSPLSPALDFLETNLRTYVRPPGGEAGIYFFSLEASSWLAVAGARASYGLPYFPAQMLMRKQGDTISYGSRRRRLGSGAGASLEVVWRVGEAVGVAAPGTLDHFLIERYWLYVARGPRLYGARVRHQPYPLCLARVERLSQSLLAAARIPPPAGATAPIVHHSPGVDVDIFWRHPVAATTR